jgi:hypothetical protein
MWIEYLWRRKKSPNFGCLKMKSFAPKMLQRARRKWRSSEIKLLRRPSIYRGRVVVSRMHISGGTRVHFDVPRVTFFTKILRIVRGNGSSESTHFPEGLVLGYWLKTFHPRNFGETETLENSWKCSEVSQGEKLPFIIFMWFTDPLSLCESITEWPCGRGSVSCFRTAET